MKHPVRPAPAPPDPGREGSYRIQRSATQISKWEDFTRDDPFFMNDFNRPKSVPPDLHNSKKKKPPPRPPPPKFASNPPPKSNSLLMNLFSRPSSATQSAKQPVRPARRELSTTAVGPLINFNSPPSSPTPTSSSDGVSVNSFGSDGNGTASHSSFSNHRSRFESGFEDDFDFFGGNSSGNVSTPVSAPDPWSATPQDPFSPPRIPVLPKAIQKPATVIPKPSVSVKPTIIRAKPSKVASRVPDTSARASKTYVDDDNDWSPPMPSIPPPPLPLEVLQEICPDVPPRPKTRHMESLKKPYGVALYDYNATHPDDLSFQANDVISLVRAVDEEWFVGRVDNREGMFPANFINVLVPLQPAQSETIVTALYPFAPEAWDDLDFPEGAKINVLSRVSADWLYGEYAGKCGQFPAAFVDHIPPNLPQRSS